MWCRENLRNANERQVKMESFAEAAHLNISSRDLWWKCENQAERGKECTLEQVISSHLQS